jgi:alginate O-acetyltransferase complex protein AlgI
MVFSSPSFLFLFLPVTLVLAYLSHRFKLRNTILLILSMFFYIFGEGELILLMFGSITLNYFIGKWIGRSKTKTAVATGVALNILILVVFKYTSFFIDNINYLLIYLGADALPQVKIKLPVGISFYTFQSMSYLIDVYRRQNEPQKSYVDLALYVCLFPQLIAGPIVRYKDVADQIKSRSLNSGKFRDGLQRFIIGLGKKVIIANSLGSAADLAFGMNPLELSSGAAWFAIICYSLQLYFDFSAYSDMAIGLGKMLGFDFLENFRFPYKSKSIREFWQRWHISLSNWFRDYLYIPLGGNRVSPRRVYFNLFIVFFLTGLWHGASWNFVIWGLIHGMFMIIERVGFGKILSRMPNILQHVYTIFIAVVAWVFFRAPDLEASTGFISAMAGFKTSGAIPAAMFMNREVLVALAAGILMSVNGFNFSMRRFVESIYNSGINKSYFKSIWRNLRSLFLLCILLYSALSVAAGSYNPFIYFRF